MYTFINEGKQFLMKLTQVSETLHFKIAGVGRWCVSHYPAFLLSLDIPESSNLWSRR